MSNSFACCIRKVVGKESGKYKDTDKQFATSRYFKREAANSTNTVALLSRSFSVYTQTQGSPRTLLHTLKKKIRLETLFAVTSYQELSVEAFNQNPKMSVSVFLVHVAS